MTSVLSVAQDASLAIGIEYPTQLYSGTTRVLRELAGVANECARMIAYDTGHDWSRLKTLGTFTGDGATLAFDLPADYRRMLKQARLWPSATPYDPFTHIADTDEWLGMQAQAFPALNGAWTIIGDQVHIRVGGSTTPLGTGDTAQFYYISDYPVESSAGVTKSAFTADEDVFRLDDRLLKLAIIYRWKQLKQQDYAEELSDYGNALAERIGNDKGSNVFAVGGRRANSLYATFAYPGTLG